MGPLTEESLSCARCLPHGTSQIGCIVFIPYCDDHMLLSIQASDRLTGDHLTSFCAVFVLFKNYDKYNWITSHHLKYRTNLLVPLLQTNLPNTHILLHQPHLPNDQVAYVYWPRRHASRLFFHFLAMKAIGHADDFILTFLRWFL